MLGPTIAGYIFDGTGDYFANGFLTGLPLLASLFFIVRMRSIGKKVLGERREEDVEMVIAADIASGEDEQEESSVSTSIEKQSRKELSIESKSDKKEIEDA